MNAPLQLQIGSRLLHSIFLSLSFSLFLSLSQSFSVFLNLSQSFSIFLSQSETVGATTSILSKKSLFVLKKTSRRLWINIKRYTKLSQKGLNTNAIILTVNDSRIQGEYAQNCDDNSRNDDHHMMHYQINWKLKSKAKQEVRRKKCPGAFEFRQGKKITLSMINVHICTLHMVCEFNEIFLIHLSSGCFSLMLYERAHESVLEPIKLSL